MDDLLGAEAQAAVDGEHAGVVVGVVDQPAHDRSLGIPPVKKMRVRSPAS
ncbi:hypothetical protein [Streptomyces sp. PanSC19]|nr:hypothetical protein [Streptomyces sp. PanSC19]